MSKRGSWWAVAILAVAVFIAIRSRIPSPAAPETTAEPPSLRQVSAKAAAPGESSLAEKAAGSVITNDFQELLTWLATDPKPDAGEIRARLLALRSKWSEMEPLLLAEMIGTLLESGDDAATGMKFRVGPHGLLEAWPTLRVFLLDALAAADPETAAKVAGRILDLTNSPDEYAVALRSLAREGPGKAENSELLERFQNALDRKEWQSSGGFAESLDLARSIGNRDAAEKLLRWEGNPALRSMALHEFAADHPAQMLEALRAEPAVDPQVRATLMARLDPQEPDQIAALDTYLRDPARTEDDASVFLKSFPLRSATTGNRLYAGPPAPYQMERIAAGDQAALALVNGWVADPALVSFRPGLLALRERLDQWVEQAK